MQPVQVDGGENIGDVWSGDVELGQHLDLAARNAGVDMQLSREVHEILLQYLQGNNTGPRSPVIGGEIARASLLRGCRFVVRVKEDVRIEETTSVHESRHD